MLVGDVVGERFVIERPIGGGGMGTVFRAADRIGGGAVAVKVLDVATEAAVERFRREARVLSELSHPGIVRYIEHGETSSRQPFIAMELLEGEDLAKRLTRGGLSVEDSLSFVRRAAEALAFAHSRDVVHRDIKPSNLFLVDNDPNRVKVLDFGIARLEQRTAALTRTGALLGTVGYMAPEQIMGSRDIDARVDVFALGCVLFECLTGNPAFVAEHIVAVFAKVMAADPPRVTALRPDLGHRIEQLVAKMLAKEPEHRLADAAAVVAALSSLAQPSSRPSTGPESSMRITAAERRVVTVILGEPQAARDGVTLAQDRLESNLDRVQEVAKRFGADAWELAGGAFVIVPKTGSAATDQAAHAASLSLALRSVSPDLRIVLATGARESTGQQPLGPVIDRAAALLRSSTLSNRQPGGAVAIDTVTQGLLASRFVVSATNGVHVLSGERAGSEAPRLLLGKATPCVGRDKELGLFELTLREVVQDNVARAILVTAPPGTGKSRLISEFVARAQVAGGARIFQARAELVSSESPLTIARQLMRSAAGLDDVEPGVEERERFEQYAIDLSRRTGADTLVEFLGELSGVSRPSAPSPILVAARNDPAIMREQKRRAFEEWIDTETGIGPVILVIEDLHWADGPTVNYLSDALRRLSGRALMVLGSARPEVRETHPALFPEQHEVRLGGLSPRAAERLVRAVLGSEADAATVARVVERADGNAFYLEELVRCVAEGDEGLPESVLAMVQSRLDRLEPDARRVLRAASAFGEHAWALGVAHMLGDSTSGDWLEVLSDREILERRRDSRFAGQREYVFRHALLRDAAYAMLTDDDRKAAHRAAGEWLENAGERDPAILADHFVRGEDDRAIRWLTAAARAALEAGGLDAAVTLATRGIELGAAGEERGTLLVILANAKTWTSADYGRTDQLKEALGLLPAGSLFWWSAVSALIWTAAALGRPEEGIPYVQLAFATRPAELSGLYGEAVIGLVTGMFSVGQVALARSFLAQFEPVLENDSGLDPVFAAWIDAARCEVSYNLPFDGQFHLESALRWGRRSFATMARAGNSTGEIVALVHLGYTSLILGAYDEAERALMRAIDVTRRTGFEFVRPYAEVFFGMLKSRRRRFDEALELVLPLCRSHDASAGNLARAAAAEAYHGQGRLPEAMTEARIAADGPSPRARRWAGALVAEVALALDRPEESLAAADRALGEPMLLSPEGERAILVARAQALKALGRADDALSAIREAADLVKTIASHIEDAELRRGYLTQVEGNARVLDLSESWGKEAESR